MDESIRTEHNTVMNVALIMCSSSPHGSFNPTPFPIVWESLDSRDVENEERVNIKGINI